jgi:integrase
MATFSTRVKLTERSAAAARPAIIKGEQRPKLYLDTQQIGFGLAVYGADTKSYFALRRVAGKQVKFTFAKYGELTVAQARDKAIQHLARMSEGVNPIEQRRQARIDAKRAEVRGITLAGALKLYEGTLRAKGRAARTIEDYRYLLEKYLPDWMDRPLADITRKDVRLRHESIVREIARRKRRQNGARVTANAPGVVPANQVMRALRAVWNRALREHPEELPLNPVGKEGNVDFIKEQRRSSRIPAAELKPWYDGVTALSNPVRRDYLLFTLFSGLRRTNAAEPRVEHIDWQRRALHVPKPKSQRPFDLPLSDFLINLLKARIEENKKLAPDSPWIFPAARGDGHIVETRPDGGEARAKNGNGESMVARYTPHDLRRTFISVAESLGISREARQLLVNHSTPKSDVHGGYVVPELEELRAHMQKIAARLLALCKGSSQDKVVPIRKRKAAR